MNYTVGTCSLCGGRVSAPVPVIDNPHELSSLLRMYDPNEWNATPTCESCGAKKKHSYGRVVEMEPVLSIKKGEMVWFDTVCKQCGAPTVHGTIHA